jgi:hypothetical protein
MMKNSLGIVKRPQVGGDVDTYCGKCKDVREHVIAAINADGSIGRVECRTCHGNHIYRERSSKAATPRSSTRGAKKESGSVVEKIGPLRAYSMQEKFAQGDRVDHPKFGVGIVVEVRAGKIDVKFGREMKTLIHAG